VATDFAGEFGKVVLYYLLLVSVVDRPGRLRALLTWIVVCVTVVSTLGLLQYHGVIDNAALRPLERKEIGPEGEDPTVLVQLRSTGIFNDPNDLCLILMTGSSCAVYRAMTAGSVAGRIVWLAPIALFVYAVLLTQSRGGLLSVLAAGIVWGHSYLGWRKLALALLVLVPVAASFIAGRQADMDLGRGDTAHQRFELWWDGFNALARNPITGIGVGEYADEMGFVAHNSFVHAYVEMGFVGGGLFLGAFFLGAVALGRGSPIQDPDSERLRQFVLAIVVGYVAGMLSLSRTFVVPTYLVLGLTAAYSQIARPSLPPWFYFDGRMAGRLVGLGIAGLIGLVVLTNLLLRVGG
jgi:O-Antigen ligase